jgi:drug/metabolite transporter (DMT)-like permease
MPQSHPHSRFGLPILYLAIFLLSLAGLFAKLIPLDAISITQLRTVVAALGLALFSLLQKRSLRLDGVKTYAGVYAIGLLQGAHWATFFHSIQLSSVAVGILSLFSFPMITILLEPLFSGQRLKVGDLIAGLVMIAGLVVMVGADLGDLQGPIVQGVLWGVFSALVFVLRNLFQKYHFNHVSSDKLMFHQVVAIALMLAAFVDYPKVSALAPEDWLNVVLLGILSTAGAHTLLVFCMKQLPVKSVALISCMQPVIAALLAWYIIKETPGASVVIGGGIVLSVAVYESLLKWRSS